VVVVRLKGIHTATKRLAGGRRVTYFYAWRGGPRLKGAPGSPEFINGYQAAHKARKTLPTGSLAFLVTSYLDSPEWRARAPSTQREWRRWCDQITTDLGTIPMEALDDSDVKKEFRAWRNKWADRPRAADYAVQVLSRVLSWAIQAGEIENNFALKLGKLYEGGDRADQIWTDDERAHFILAAPSTEVAFIVELACLTGLRREDLASLKWADVGELYISKSTGKSRGRKTATIPIIPETAFLLNEIQTHRQLSGKIGKLDGAVLTNTRGQPWTPSGLSHAVTAFGGKRLHDCRGTLATILRKGGLKASEIADIMGWQEDRVERILSTYVDRDAIVKSLAERMGRA
jgi:integrase